MDFDFFKHLVDISCEKKIGFVHLYGVGESYLVDDINKYFNYALKKYSEYGVDTILTSNGERITQIPHGLSEVIISFNAGKKETYERITGINFDRTVQNIYRLNKEGQLGNNVIIRMLVSKETESEVESFYNLFEYIDAHLELSYKFDNQHNEIENQTISNLIYNIDSRVPCNYVTRGINVCWNGDVILCPHDFESEYIYGNLYDQTWEDILNSELRKKMLHEHNKLIFTGLCEKCNYNTKFKTSFLKKLK
jgi:radical SAM protein with 4Fe4S-binding SPASM domain